MNKQHLVASVNQTKNEMSKDQRKGVRLLKKFLEKKPMTLKEENELKFFLADVQNDLY